MFKFINIFEKETEYPWYKYYNGMRKHLNYPDTSMYELVRKNSKRHLHDIAYSYYGTKVTYKGFLNKIDRCAEAYSYYGVKKGTVVTIIMPNTPEAIISIYALNKLGAIVNMMHPMASEEEIKYGINLTKSKIILMCDIVYSKIDSIKKDTDVKDIIWVSVSETMGLLTKIGFMLTKGRSISKPDSKYISWHEFMSKAIFNKNKIKDTNKGNDDAVILYSGGTTGKQKGIVLTNLNMNSLCMEGIEIAQVIHEGVKVLAIMPIFHGFGLGVTIHVTFVSGAEAQILPTVNPKEFDKTILSLKPNIIACVPSLLETVTYSNKMKDANLSFIKGVFCGGDSLSVSLNRRLDEFLYSHKSEARVRTAYGMTECSAGACMMPLGESREGSIGIPLSDGIIKIIDPNTKIECGVGEIGEICINGPTVMKGYYNNSKETNNVLRMHEDNKIWLHSGDLGYIDKDGFVYFTSRLKRMIVSSGYNIYPGEMEEIINAHPYVKTCIVVGVPHPYKVEVCKAYIVLKDDIVLTGEVKSNIKDYCEKKIAKYSLPYAYGYRKELPKTLLGKVAYRELEKGKDEDEEK